MLISQAEADMLIAMEKQRISDENIELLALTPLNLNINLISMDYKEEFVLSIWRSFFSLQKSSFRNFAKKTITLVRVDLGGRPHRNPDGEEIGCPHIHIYREGFGDKWAFELPTEKFSDPSNFLTTHRDFLSYCNITRPPNFVSGLFHE